MTTCGMHDPNDAFACDEKKGKMLLQTFIYVLTAFHCMRFGVYQLQHQHIGWKQRSKIIRGDCVSG